MKVKELIKRLQSLGQELEVYIWKEKEHSLFVVEDAHETSDFGENEKGENEWEDFVTIFPTNNYHPLITLTPEEVGIVKDALESSQYIAIQILTAYDDSIPTNTKFDNLLNRIKQWQEEKS